MTNTVFKIPFIMGLLVLAILCIVLVFVVDLMTQDQIEENRLASSRRIYNDIIPYEYTNDIFNDGFTAVEPDYFGTQRPVTINRIRDENSILGVIIFPVIANGYKSDIELGIGIDRSGVITGVRVLYENETAGLGDQVHQDKTAWIDIFTGKSTAQISRDQWRVESDGGEFDQISGATITSRSVINAVKSALDYHRIASDQIYLER